MPVVSDSPPILSEGVLIRSYVAHTDGLKDAAPMRAGECRHYSSVVGVAAGLKLIGPNPRNYRDWALEGLFNMTDVATGERTHATRMFNRDRRFFVAVKDSLKSGKAVEFSYEFYVEKRAVGGGLKKRLRVIGFSPLETSDFQKVLRSGRYSVFKVFHPTASP
jgi:hypothetical protein